MKNLYISYSYITEYFNVFYRIGSDVVFYCEKQGITREVVKIFFSRFWQMSLSDPRRQHLSKNTFKDIFFSLKQKMNFFCHKEMFVKDSKKYNLRWINKYIGLKISAQLVYSLILHTISWHFQLNLATLPLKRILSISHKLTF